MYACGIHILLSIRNTNTYNGLKVLPVARLLHADKTTGVSPEAEEVEESGDSLLEEITASPPRFECYHGE